MKSLSEMKEKILKTIWETGDPVTMQEIAEKMGLKARSANMHLLGLRKAGFVTMSGDRYVITEKGKELIGLPKIDGEMAEKILNKRLSENAFHFYTGVDQPLGVSSDSLIDLFERIRMVDIKSIEFHVARGDFERWIRDVFQDITLAERMSGLRKEGLRGEELRKRLIAAIKDWYEYPIEPDRQLKSISEKAN